MSYEDFCGMFFCRSELLAQAAYAQFLGASFAGSLEDVPPELFLAICDDEATAFELMVATNSARSRAKAARERTTGQHIERLF